ncbi:stearoyl-CoA desaturase 5-like [Oppia nitens]|uniref:stearoyl-CoA desaturase 5-like n=1 Tax=Oppia nitens TaxID=1686743 RepID=UPI0023DC3017|nr:stearoyl-CoA desaturase 5-like [Oppia nitens]
MSLQSLKTITTDENKCSADGHKSYKLEIVWRNIILMTLLHTSALYGIWITLMSAKWQTIYAMFFFGLASALGVLAGAHRLWSHRAYKAKWPLRLILAFLETMALQNDIYEWCRDHRVHHKFSETDADPHNSNRGFFFAHMGWLLCRKHPEVISKGKAIEMNDIWDDPIVRFQRRFYIPLLIIIWAFIPTYIPYKLWAESLWNSFFTCVALRYVYVLHNSWLVNSAAHLYGNRPYDKNIESRENQAVQYLAHGEGYHNYHHTFPWDYSASELGWKDNFNTATLFIDFFSWIGWAYDLKKVPQDVVIKRQIRTGDPNFKRWSTLKDYCIGFTVTFLPIYLAFLGRAVATPLILYLFF